MKHLSNFFYTLCILAFAQAIQAQNTCCDASTVAPQITTGFYGTQVAGSASTPGVSLAVNASADLVNVEYVVTKRNSVALDNNGVIDSTDGQPSGSVIIGSNVSGIFVPDNLGRYGVSLNAGDTFDVTAVGYDLSLVSFSGFFIEWQKCLRQSLLRSFSIDSFVAWQRSFNRWLL